MDKDHFLNQIFDPQKFSIDDHKLILNQYSRVTFKKNDYIIPEGRTANYYFFLESGFARSYAVDLEGNDITTQFFVAKDIIIDWRSYFLKTPSREYIQAISEVTAWRIPFEKFMNLFHIEPFREVGRTRLVNSYFELKNHTVSMIADSAKDRYLDLISKKPEVAHNFPLKQIATYLGITDTSLSRIRKDIARNK